MPDPVMPDSIAGKVAALEMLQMSEGWLMIRQIFLDNIDYLGRAIIDKRDPETKEPLTEEEVDSCRYKRNLNLEVLDTPTKYAQMLLEKRIVPVNFDPYERVEEPEEQQ